MQRQARCAGAASLSIASPSRQRAADNRSRRPASKIERLCPRAREQAACHLGALTATLQVGRAAQQRCEEIKKRCSGVTATPPRSAEPRRQFAHECGIPMEAATSSSAHGAHRATPVSRRCVLATCTTKHRRGMEPVCSKSLGVLLQAALAFSGGASIVCGRFDELGFYRSVELRSALGVRGFARRTASA